MSAAKTNALRLLERQKIPHEVLTYAFDPDDMVAASVAARLGLPPQQVFKTLAVRASPGGVILAVVPADCELDLKALARAAGAKHAEPLPLREVEPATGYVRGAVTALACKKPYPVFLDERALALERLCVSAGRHGLQVLLAPADYLRVTGGHSAPLGRAPAHAD